MLFKARFRARTSDDLVAILLASLAAAAFWIPAAAVGRGYFPAPLDDVYIHFDFARSLGQGHPFEWIAGQGYSSGETSPLYAVLLAIGWVIGFRGRLLGVWAAVLAVLSVASLLGTVRRFVRPSPWWLAWLLALLPLSIGISDWALFSGMEVAVFVAVLGKALEALAKTRASRVALEGRTRSSHQWRLGLWGAALVLLRPEAGVVVGVLGVIAARGAGARSGILALVRSTLPGALATLMVLGSNWLFTGDARSAGAQLKLLSSNPYMSDVDRARVFTENLITFWVKVVRGELAAIPVLLAVMPLLALVGIVLPPRRTLASACVLSAIAWLLLVSWNGNAPHHNFRYYVPALVLMCMAAAFGLASLAERLRRKRALAMSALTIFVLAVGAWKIPGQAGHFRTASANIRDQHIEVAERIAAKLPADARVLLGDAGVIPYVSNRAAIDALGLGGYRGVPFVRAAVHGEPAMLELIERLDPAERPTHFALYPNWFAATTGRFGVEIDRVTIEHNVICGSPTKVIYRADWSALESSVDEKRDLMIDAVDVGDVIDEAKHHYTAPLPHGGWTTLDVLIDGSTGAKRFDGGRIIPYLASESFVVKASENGPLVLSMRIDKEARGIVLKIPRQGVEKELTLDPVHDGEWRLAKTTLDHGIQAGDEVILEARAYAYSSFHIWITRAEAVVTKTK